MSSGIEDKVKVDSCSDISLTSSGKKGVIKEQDNFAIVGNCKVNHNPNPKMSSAIEVLKEMVDIEHRSIKEYSKYPTGSFSNNPVQECRERITAIETACLALEQKELFAKNRELYLNSETENIKLRSEKALLKEWLEKEIERLERASSITPLKSATSLVRNGKILGLKEVKGMLLEGTKNE